MKTLKNNIILYDGNCPLCKAYTGAFVTCGLLDRNGRSEYNLKDPQLFSYVDQDRARNEIALVDLDQQTVTYGIDSLIKILGHQRPLLSAFLRFPLVYYPSKFFYALVSYNRKMIAPSKSKPDACIPAFNVFYRLVFLLLTCLFTGFVLYQFITPILQYNQLHTGVVQEMLVVAGQVLFQATALWLMRQKNIADYLGHMMTVSTIGALLLLPAIWIYNLAGFNFYYALLYFAAVVGFMFLLHLKRCIKLGLNLSASISWIVYRVLVLTVILYLS